MKRCIKQILHKVRTGFSPTVRTDSEEGQLLVWSIIILAFGSLVIIGLLSYVTVGIRVTNNTLEDAEEYYAAGAGVKAVVADLIQGTDIFDIGYTKPSITLNNYSVNISISAASPGSVPLVQYRYFNPRASGNLTLLAPDAHYTFQLDNVVMQSDFRIHWVFAPVVKSWTITLYEGTGTSGPIVATDNLSLGPGYLRVDGSFISGGTYTIDFHNISDSSLNSASFNAGGGSRYTWIYTRARKDYVTTATAGDTTIAVYIRQEPGPTTSPNAAPTVTILSWQAPATIP